VLAAQPTHDSDEPKPDDWYPPLQMHEAETPGAALLAGHGVHTLAPKEAV